MAGQKTKETRVRRFTLGVTLTLMVLCNVVLLGGLWASGVNLEHILGPSEFFDSTKDHCVRIIWTKVVGVDRPMRLCSEWLVPSDPTGRTHAVRMGEPLALGQDGQLYYANDRGQDFRLVGLVIFVAGVIFSGAWLKRFLIARYRRRLEET